MIRQLLDFARILVFGLLAFILGGLSIDWFGTAWWSRVLAAITVFSVMVFADQSGAEDAGA